MILVSDSNFSQQCFRGLLLLLLLLLLLTAIELSLGGSSAYTSTDKTNKNKYTSSKQYKKKTQYKQYKTQ
jgi:hypothetical protein